jgi:hypothetical protein
MRARPLQPDSAPRWAPPPAPSLLLALVLLLVAAAAAPAAAHALPKNFRNVDIFYVGAMPTDDDIHEMAALGIQHIISLHRMPASTLKAAKRAGIQVHDYPWRTRLEHVEEVMGIIEMAPPNSVFVHCMHGADRTGAATAYWLHTRLNYDPFIALAAVVSPRHNHIKGLEMLATEYNYEFAVADDITLGRFSGARNGGLEGLKLRGGRWYAKLARNYLELTVGPPLRRPSKEFWKEDL